MRPIDEIKIVFSLPHGMTMGGVESWVRSLSPHLAKSYVVAHPAWEHVSFPHEFPEQKIFSGDVLIAGLASDLNSTIYQQLAPAVFVPNYHPGTYETLAKIMSSPGHGVKVLGMAHADNQAEYRILVYFESIIGTFVATSEEVATQLRKLLPANRGNDIKVRSCAVDIERLPGQPVNLPGVLRLVYAGRIVSEQKRVLDLVPFIRELHSSGVDFQLAIAGDGLDLPALKKAISNLGQSITRRVQILGMVPQKELLKIYSDSHIFIQCSEYEGASLAMLEAMGRGCVPVVTNVSGAKNLIKHQHNGMLFNVADTQSMSRIVCNLANDRQLVNRMRYAAWASTEKYTRDDYLDWMEGVLLELSRQHERIWPKTRPVEIPWRKPVAKVLGKLLPLSLVKLLYQQSRRFFR